MAINWTVSRRTALKGLGAGAVALPAFLKGEARAEGGRVVIGTWGGDYARLELPGRWGGLGRRSTGSQQEQDGEA